jgi:hypothetical protein
MTNLIEVKYQYAEHPNAVLRKLFKTQQQIDSFKNKHPDYIYLN